jgi:hypothetical protein
MVLVLIVWLLCGILTAFIAQSKGLSVGTWAIVGILAGFIGVLIVALVPSKTPAR